MKKLHEHLNELIKEVCDVLKDKSIPQLEWTRLKRVDENNTEFPVETRPNSQAVVIFFVENRDKLKAFSKICEYIYSNHRLQNALKIEDQFRLNISTITAWAINFLTVPFVASYYKAVKSFLFDQDKLDLVITEFFSGLNVSEESCISISPLLNIKLEPMEIQIDKGIVLRKLTSDELEEWFNPVPYGHEASMSTSEAVNLYCGIQLTGPTTKGYSISLDHQTLVNTIVTLIRLLTNRNVYVFFTETISHDPGRPLISQKVRISSPSLRSLNEPALINAAEADNIRKLWNKLNSSPNASFVKLAFTRWGVTSERLSDEDKILDYWIALESLFIPDSAQELSYRASIRIASYLGDSPDRRLIIYDDMRKSYKWRSAIIHGSVSDLKKLEKSSPLKIIAEKTRLYLREAIIKILEANEKFDPTGIEIELLKR